MGVRLVNLSDGVSLLTVTMSQEAQESQVVE